MEGDASQAGDDQVQRLIAQEACRQVLEALVRGYQHVIVRYCTVMLGDVAHREEVAQEVFLRAYAALPRFRREATIGTWLLVIARKQCLMALHDRRRLDEDQWQEIARGAHHAPPVPPEEDPEAQRQRVRWGLDRLGSAERTVLMLRCETGLPLVEMAHILGHSAAGMRRQLARALEQLRTVLEEGT